MRRDGNNHGDGGCQNEGLVDQIDFLSRRWRLPEFDQGPEGRGGIYVPPHIISIICGRQPPITTNQTAQSTIPSTSRPTDRLTGQLTIPFMDSWAVNRWMDRIRKTRCAHPHLAPIARTWSIYSRNHSVDRGVDRGYLLNHTEFHSKDLALTTTCEPKYTLMHCVVHACTCACGLY